MATLSGLFLLIVTAAPAEPARATNAAGPSDRRAGSVQVTVRQTMVVRVPRAVTPARTAFGPVPALPPIVWEEKSAPRCVPVGTLAAAAITRRDAVDLVLAGGKRLRARFDDDCPTLDFYRGFYLKPNKDGMVCADRDVIRSRAGGECRIDSFRRLVPRK